MDVTQATKLIKLYQYDYANSDPGTKDYYHNLANNVRAQLGNPNFMTNTADTSWTPDKEDWSDIAGTKYGTELGKIPASPAVTETANVTNNNSVNDNVIARAPTSGNQASTQPVVYGDTSQQPQPAPAAAQQPVYDPVATAQANLAAYQQSMIGAKNTEIDAQIAQAQSLLNSGGIWKTLQPIAQQQMQDALATIEKTSAIAKANIEASRASMNAEEAANYDAAIQTIDQNLIASRQRTTEEMNQRGLFFSTVLDGVMGKVEAASATQRGTTARQHMVNLAKIAAQMATLSGNIDIETIKGNAAAVAQYTAEMLQIVAQDEQTKQTAQSVLAGLDAQKAGVYDTVASAIFGTQQSVMSNARQEASNLEITDWNNWLAGIGQYAGDYQAEINNQQTIVSDPNATADQKSVAAKKITALNAARTNKLDTNFETWKATTNSFANDYQAAINKLDPKDPMYAQKKSYLTGLRMDKIVELAKTKETAAQQEVANAYKMGELSVDQYNAVTARIKAVAPKTTGTGTGTSTGGTSTTSAKVSFANAQAIKNAYEADLTTIAGYKLNPDTGMYEKATTDIYGAPSKKSMAPDEYQMYVDRIKEEKPNYDAAVRLQSISLGTTLTGDDAINADTIVQEVIGVQRTHYGISNKDALDLVLTSKDSKGETIMQFLLKQPNGQSILRTLQNFYGVDILGG
jgi:hypothetical protein